VELLARTAWNANLKVKDLYDTLMKEGFNLDGVIPERVDTVWHDEKKQKQFFNHLLTVFDLSNVTKEELDVLTNLSVLPADVPMDDFCEWMNLKSKDVINNLVRKDWLKREGGMLFMHNVIQEVIRHRAAPDVEKCENLIISIGTKLYLEPHENPITKQPYLRFGESVGRFVRMDTRDKEGSQELASLAYNLAEVYWHLGSLSKALEFQSKALKIRKKVLETNHSDLAQSYNSLSGIYWTMGDLEKALEFQLKALEIREEVLDKNHPDLATSYNNLSSTYYTMGDLEKALEFQLKALEIRGIR
jgi:tetratricopeptide (TPR) repeat protein